MFPRKRLVFLSPVEPVKRCRAYGKTKQWQELAALSKNKKSVIGFGPFIDVCVEAGCKDEAVRYSVIHILALPKPDRCLYFLPTT